MERTNTVSLKRRSPSTVGRARPKNLESAKAWAYKNSFVKLNCGDSLNFYSKWDCPDCIISDGAYGILGFEGDTSDHLDLPHWYEPHIKAWSAAAKPNTNLWFWNSEIGWASVHPILEKHGWRYINANIWNKGKGHIAGNVNTTKIRRFPVVTEICVQYVFEPRINGMLLKEWLKSEWMRSGLPLGKANEACGVADAAVRKYLDLGHLWYFPPPDMFERLSAYANIHGEPDGKPYFSMDSKRPMTKREWEGMRSHFNCPHGVTNVWERPALRDSERIRVDGKGKAVHLNQKPVDLMKMLIESSSKPGQIVWEPFGGLFSASFAAQQLGRRAFSAELDPSYFNYGSKRFL